MELQFQKPQGQAQQQQQHCHYQVPGVAKETGKPSSRARSKCGGGGKFVGVRQRPSGRWVAEIKDTTQKIRMWLGTFETAEEAARAYDEAACLLRGANTRTNFAAGAPTASQPDSPLASRIRALLNHKKFKKSVSQSQQPAVAFSPTAAYRHGDTITATAASTGASTITTSSVSPSSSASSATINFAMTSGGVRTPILPAAHNVTEEACYRPYLIGGGSEEFQQQYEQPWALNTCLLPPNEAGENACSAMAELEKISPEKESPASSPHGVDRVQDQDFYDAGNDLWDLPPICPLSCRSLMY